jgi:hypothetical protein
VAAPAAVSEQPGGAVALASFEPPPPGLLGRNFGQIAIIIIIVLRTVGEKPRNFGKKLQNFGKKLRNFGKKLRGFGGLFGSS